MFARLLAAFCLYHVVVVSGWASEVVVYLRAGASQSPRTVEIMKRELAPLMLSAGYQVEWRDGQGSTDAALVVLELQGTCAMPSGSIPSDSTDIKDLASTAVSGNAVLPFSSINCGALTRMLAPSLASEAGARRDFLYGRAMARLTAHELYHILANTREHDRYGLAKPRFTAADLLTERFEFEHTADSVTR